MTTAKTYTTDKVGVVPNVVYTAVPCFELSMDIGDGVNRKIGNFISEATIREFIENLGTTTILSEGTREV